MRKISVFFIVFLTLHGCQNNSSVIDKCNLNIQNGIAYSEGKVYNGTCNLFYNDSILWKTRTYKRGLEVKEIGYFLPGGELEYIGYKKDGHIHGDFISYYKNGTVSIKGKLNKGLYKGEWNYWDDDGSLNKTLIYNQEGLATDTIYHK